MKILITGVNGQVGDALCKLAKQKGHDVIPITRLEWDMYRSPNFGEDIVLKHSPDLVINPAAYTNVVGAESEEDIEYSQYDSINDDTEPDFNKFKSLLI